MFSPTHKTFNWRLFVYTRKNLLLGITAILASLLIVFLAIWPQITSILETQSKLVAQQTELKKVQTKLQELDDVKISPEFRQVDTVNQVLPTKKPLLELLTGLNTIAAATQVGVSNLKIAPGQIATDSAQLTSASRNTKNAYDSLALTLTVSGQLSNVQRFLSLIEQISPITTITKINLSRGTKLATGEVTTKAELTLSTHYFTQQITASLLAPLPKITQHEKEIFQTLQGFTIPTADTPNQIEGGGNSKLFTIDEITQ